MIIDSPTVPGFESPRAQHGAAVGGPGTGAAPPLAAWEVYGEGGYASDDQVATGRAPTLEAARACVEAVAAQGPCGVGE